MTTANTYIKYAPNVYLAKCSEKHEKGDEIEVENKWGKANASIVHNLVCTLKDGSYCYSITRADGYNAQERAKAKAERLQGYASTANGKSNERWQASNEGRDFLALAEPIKIGHHSEKRHRALIQRNHDRMSAAVELSKKAEEYERRAAYWAAKTEDINLSMPESLEYYAHLLEKAQREHQGLKDGSIPKAHSYSLTYAKKWVNEAQKSLDLAQKLWGE